MGSGEGRDRVEELGDGLVQVSFDYKVQEAYLHHRAFQSLTEHSYPALPPVQLQIPSGEHFRRACGGAPSVWLPLAELCSLPRSPPGRHLSQGFPSWSTKQACQLRKGQREIKRWEVMLISIEVWLLAPAFSSLIIPKRQTW